MITFNTFSNQNFLEKFYHLIQKELTIFHKFVLQVHRKLYHLDQTPLEDVTRIVPPILF